MLFFLFAFIVLLFINAVLQINKYSKQMNKERPSVLKIIRSVESLNSTLNIQKSLKLMANSTAQPTNTMTDATAEDVAKIIQFLEQQLPIEQWLRRRVDSWKHGLFYADAEAIPAFFDNPIEKLNFAYHDVGNWANRYLQEILNTVEDEDLDFEADDA